MTSFRKLSHFFLLCALILAVIASLCSAFAIGVWLYGAGMALGLWFASLVTWLNDPETAELLSQYGMYL